MTVALPPAEDRSLADVWSALGGELKPSLDVQVTAPMTSGQRIQAGPLVREAPRFGVTRMDAADEEVLAAGGESQPGRIIRIRER
jgi:hypothetical protein